MEAADIAGRTGRDGKRMEAWGKQEFAPPVEKTIGAPSRNLRASISPWPVLAAWRFKKAGYLGPSKMRREGGVILQKSLAVC